MELSVIIPSRDRPQRLLQTLQALTAAAHPGPRWEAVVVDDGSAPASTEPIARWIRETAAPVRLLAQDARGPAAARNRGAREARGRVLVFLDDDMVVAAGFLSRHLRAVVENPGCWVVGRITHPPELLATAFGRYRHARWEEFHEAHAPAGLQATGGMSAANLALPALDLARLGGFDERFALAGCEDRELAMRARTAGVRVLYDPENVAIHQDWATTMPRFCERQRSYAISDVRLWRLHGEASPRAGLVTANAPLARGDGPRQAALKLAKSALDTVPGRALVRGLSAVAERLAPDGALTRKAYDAEVALAIFRGVREGLRNTQPGPVVHLIDANADTAYFRAIARWTSGPVSIGSLAGEGPLQSALRAGGTPSFALGARSRLAYPETIVRLAWRLRTTRARLLHAHCFDPTLVGLLAARLARVPFVFTRHHSDHHLRLGKRWHTRVDSWCARKADRVIAVSDATRRILVETEGANAERVSVVWNGIDRLAEPAPAELEALRRSLALPAGARICVMPARLHEEKGHRVLLDALPEVLAAEPSFVVLCAGGGPHRADIEEAVRARGFTRVMRFLGQRDDVPALVVLGAVVVLPSLAESFGFAALEAMSLGRPVVASRAGGLPEVVTTGETGLLVEVGDARGLARALLEILAHPARAAAMGEAGRDRARRFTAQGMVRGYEAVYADLAR